ncbi:nitroreductase family protein [Bifidobacterium crudilactis]|jgi:nitroreductase|uniref:nitroreductase family protein n=1 Tax=Bifidobacterium crudilactis TaxID=327277 RepID=UPI000550C49E|nr:nitroreductase family protein [Bifidobacterium crudilactis]MCI1664622.1 nitroreductase family protein [Bifidobacterium crudilactis]
MTNLTTNDFTDILEGRRSIRQYDPKVSISREEMLEMLNEAAKAPSSVNMQPWRFLIVQSEEGRATLKPLIRFNKRQNKSSSAMIVVFGDMRCYEYADRIYTESAEKGIMPKLMAKTQLSVIVPTYRKYDRAKMNDVVKIDSSLFAMQFMLVARSHGYDTNPIGGFEEDRIAEAFGLDAERYVPVLIMSIGKADSEGHTSFRLPAEELTWWR